MARNRFADDLTEVIRRYRNRSGKFDPRAIAGQGQPAFQFFEELVDDNILTSPLEDPAVLFKAMQHLCEVHAAFWSASEADIRQAIDTAEFILQQAGQTSVPQDLGQAVQKIRSANGKYQLSAEEATVLLHMLGLVRGLCEQFPCMTATT